MWDNNRMQSKCIVLVVLLFQSVTSVNLERRRSNVLACSEIDYNVNSNGCYEFKGLGSWTQAYIEKLCGDGVNTDKNTTATLCSDYQSNEAYQISLKLAILNQMYGTTTVPAYGKCGYYCMYDPLHVDGDDAVGFK
jgi:hypothetical protein